VLVVCLALCGCTQDPYGASAKLGQDIAVGIGGAMTTVDQMHSTGLITGAEESNILGYMQFANVADGAFLVCVGKAHAATTPAPGVFTACVNAFNSSLNIPSELALLKVANPSAQTQINSVVTPVAAAITTLLTFLGGK
jgi:hypothetical protein